MTNNKIGIPKLRFPGFTGPWEQRKLGEVGKCQSGIGFPNSEQGGTKGIPFFKVSDMNTLGNETEMIIANNYVTEEQVNRKKWKPIEEVPAMFFAKVGAAVLLDRKRLVTRPFLLDNNTMTYKFGNEWNIRFGKAVFETICLPKLAQTGALPSYNASDIENVQIYMPKAKGEQQKVGTFFQQLDKLITLHQRKLDDLKTQKKGLLQKMFPKKGADVPEVRFPEFTETWEQRKFKDFITKSGKKNTKNENYPAYSVSNKLGLVSQTEQFDGSRLDNLDKTAYKFVYENEFAYNPARVNVGSIAFNDLGKTVIVSSLYVVLKMSEKLDNEYVLQFIKSPKFIEEVKRNTEGSVREYLFFDNFKNIKFPYTKNIEEQIKISSFLKQFDKLITLHQRKIEHLQLQKKGLLQQMFV